MVLYLLPPANPSVLHFKVGRSTWWCLVPSSRGLQKEGRTSGRTPPPHHARLCKQHLAATHSVRRRRSEHGLSCPRP
ncbi:hypothetical protein BHE74_00024589 [Ensete ventricosum]|uniref:Uncharacterized protein n=1 Tax=Ensete ventricosum TaxID=4639 RepID=A0A426YZ87_ENSVE|nr:hypothetical protein B296_00004187 [Ensete ventricosum]RWW17240.1 hypothetical protein GW17_00018843 [Ensete ventricosum]RWW67922.1 hypothetical protein BHE74_00024589 [Ensete ventricosum]RZR74175.1 hypothetical protein BHM03_00033097 [Ensete ventricosum]